MGLLGTIFGGGANSVIKAVGNVVDGLHTSDEERAAASLDAYKAETERIIVEQEGAKGQQEINKIEAQHSSLFVAGWRPAIGWTCACGLFWHFIGYEMVSWAAAIWHPTMTPPPQLDGYELIGLTTALLGIGGLRTYEKMKGTAREGMATGGK